MPNENTNSNNSANENNNSANANENANSDQNANKENTDSKKQVPLSEVISERKKRQALEVELDKIKADQKKLADGELKKKGDLQKLLDQKEEEIKTLNSTLKPKADEYDKFRQEEIEAVKKVLGDKWDDDFGNLSLPALRKMAVTLSKKPDPNLDGGSNGAGSIGKELTASQKKEAYEKFPNWSKEKAEEAWLDVLISTGKIK